LQCHWYFLDVDQRDQTTSGFITPADRYMYLSNPEDFDLYETERLNPLYFHTKKVPDFANHFDIEMTGTPIVGASTYSGGGAIGNPTQTITPQAVTNNVPPVANAITGGFLVPTTISSAVTDSGSTSFNTTNVLGSIPAVIVGNPTNDDRWVHHQVKDPSIDPVLAWYDKTFTAMTHHAQRTISTDSAVDNLKQVFAFDVNPLVKPLKRFVDFEIDVRDFQLDFENNDHTRGCFMLLCRGSFPLPGGATVRSRFIMSVESRLSFLE